MITVSHFEQTTTACPAQWVGETADGRYLYIRYRWGRLRVDTASSEEAWLDESETVFSASIGDPMNGSMGTEEMKRHLAGVVDFSGAAQHLDLDALGPVE